MRRYTATAEELQQYIDIRSELAEIEPRLADIKARLADWEAAHGEDIPDVPQ